MSGIIVIPLDKIEVGTRVRPAYPDKVAALAASIDNCATGGIGWDGLRLPVEVIAKGDGYVLVSGLTRLRALESLDREAIAATVLDVTTITARQLELEENLVRSELTKLDRALFVAGFRDLFEAEHGEVKAGRPSGDNTDNMSVFFSEAPARLGMNEKAIERCLKIAKGLRSDVVDMLRGTDWDDNQKALLELAGVPVEKQGAVINILLDEEVAVSSMRDAIAMLDGAKTAGPREDALQRWYAVFNLRKPQQKTVLREWIAQKPDVVEEVLADMGFTVQFKDR